MSTDFTAVVARTRGEGVAIKSFSSLTQCAKRRGLPPAKWLVFILCYLVYASGVLAQEIGYQLRSGAPVWLLRQELNRDAVKSMRIENQTHTINQSLYSIEYAHKSGWTAGLASGRLEHRFKVYFDSIEDQYHGWLFFIHRFKTTELSLGHRFYSDKRNAHWHVKISYSHQPRDFPRNSIRSPLESREIYPFGSVRGSSLRYETPIDDGRLTHWNMAGIHLERQMHYRNRLRLSYILGCQIGLQQLDNMYIYMGNSGFDLTRMSLNMVYPSASVKLSYNLQGLQPTVSKYWNKFTKWLII